MVESSDETTSREGSPQRNVRSPKNRNARVAIADISKLLAQMSEMQRTLEAQKAEQVASQKVKMGSLPSEGKKVASQKAKAVASKKVNWVASPEKVKNARRVASPQK